MDWLLNSGARGLVCAPDFFGFCTSEDAKDNGSRQLLASSTRDADPDGMPVLSSRAVASSNNFPFGSPGALAPPEMHCFESTSLRTPFQRPSSPKLSRPARQSHASLPLYTGKQSRVGLFTTQVPDLALPQAGTGIRFAPTSDGSYVVRGFVAGSSAEECAAITVRRQCCQFDPPTDPAGVVLGPLPAYNEKNMDTAHTGLRKPGICHL